MICIIASAGGHLTEALKVTEKFDYPCYYITYNLPHIKNVLGNKEYYLITNPHKNIFKYIINFFQSLLIYLKKRPKVIITTGSGMAIFTCLIGKAFGAKLIYMEINARITTPSLTGRFLYPFADLFIIQWQTLRKYYKKAVYGGSLI